MYVDPYNILCKELSFSYQENLKIIKKLKRSFKWYNAFRYRESTVDGATITLVSIECLIWFREVELKKGNPKDLKIKYLESYIEVLEDYLKIPHERMEYCDLPLKYLRTHFNKTKNAIGVATNRMKKHFPYSLKYIKYGKVYVSSIGVKWLNEKYFRTKYTQYLENYKDSLESRISN